MAENSATASGQDQGASPPSVGSGHDPVMVAAHGSYCRTRAFENDSLPGVVEYWVAEQSVQNPAVWGIYQVLIDRSSQDPARHSVTKTQPQDGVSFIDMIRKLALFEKSRPALMERPVVIDRDAEAFYFVTLAEKEGLVFDCDMNAKRRTCRNEIPEGQFTLESIARANRNYASTRTPTSGFGGLTQGILSRQFSASVSNGSLDKMLDSIDSLETLDKFSSEIQRVQSLLLHYTATYRNLNKAPLVEDALTMLGDGVMLPADSAPGKGSEKNRNAKNDGTADARDIPMMDALKKLRDKGVRVDELDILRLQTIAVAHIILAKSRYNVLLDEELNKKHDIPIDALMDSIRTEKELAFAIVEKMSERYPHTMRFAEPQNLKLLEASITDGREPIVPQEIGDYLEHYRAWRTQTLRQLQGQREADNTAAKAAAPAARARP